MHGEFELSVHSLLQVFAGKLSRHTRGLGAGSLEELFFRIIILE